ncbi:MAG TPA: glycogen synthase [Anaerolineaceae bacterium]|nr:glycogen synthase [Anaerolineaceae bacterium]
MKNKTIRVLFLASEADPLVKVGGLGDVSGSLPKALENLPPDEIDGNAVEVRLVLPFHSDIRKKIPNPVYLFNLEVQSIKGPVQAQAFFLEVNGIRTYLIAGPPIPEEGPVYNPVAAVDGPKFVFFSLASLELAKKLDWKPDILHANDWHTALSIYQLKIKKDPFFENTHTVLTLHNLPFFGVGTEAALTEYAIPPSRLKSLPSWARHLPLPLGLQAAEKIVAVSPTYAREILTPEYGCGLEQFLKRRKKAIIGILNGLDQDSWNPAIDPAIAVNYSTNSLDSRQENRKALIYEFSLNTDPGIPIFILVSRMDHQKGVDIAIDGLRAIKDQNWQAILLGAGDPNLERACLELEQELPERVRAVIRFDTNLSRRIYGGGDILLMPSRYEPCGLTQMMAMRYGCVPIARATGGLVDTISDLAAFPAKATGFLFNQPTVPAFVEAINRVYKAYLILETWRQLQLHGMKQDFSWHQSAIAYAKTYQQLMKGDQ